MCYAAAGEHRYYHSIMKYGKCLAAHPSDLAPALVALKAKAVIAGTEGERQMPLEKFFLGSDNHGENVLKSNELLIEVHLPKIKGRTTQVFLKHRIRRSFDFSLSNVAMVVQTFNKVVEDIRIVIGGVAPFPYIASNAEETIKGRKLSKKAIFQAAEAAVEEAKPLPNNYYKLHLTKALVRRALRTACQD